jgi:hypothetical protein
MRQTIFDAMEERATENGPISCHQIISILDEFRNSFKMMPGSNWKQSGKVRQVCCLYLMSVVLVMVLLVLLPTVAIEVLYSLLAADFGMCPPPLHYLLE